MSNDSSARKRVDDSNPSNNGNNNEKKEEATTTKTKTKDKQSGEKGAVMIVPLAAQTDDAEKGHDIDETKKKQKKKQKTNRKRPQAAASESATSDPNQKEALITKKQKHATATTTPDSNNSSSDNEIEPQEEERSEQEQQQQQQEIRTAENDDWSDDIHRHLVEAIFKIGIRQASPSVILENMRNQYNLPLTAERVKSRLQKYRNNSQKSQTEFLNEYDSWLAKAMTVGRLGGDSSGLTDPKTTMDIMGVDNLLGGHVAAFLTYSIKAQEAKDGGKASAGTSQEASPDEGPSLHTSERNGSLEYAKYLTGSTIKLPFLSEEEKKTPLGISLNHVVSLFYSMTHQVMKLRQGSNDDAFEQKPPAQKREYKEKTMRKMSPSESQQQQRGDGDSYEHCEEESTTERKREHQQSMPPPYHRDTTLAPQHAAQALYTMADLANMARVPMASNVSHPLGSPSPFLYSPPMINHINYGAATAVGPPFASLGLLPPTMGGLLGASPGTFSLASIPSNAGTTETATGAASAGQRAGHEPVPKTGLGKRPN